jgi:hypothetical protein
MNQDHAFARADTVMRRCLLSAQLIIDAQFGETYAIKNPALVAALARIGFDSIQDRVRFCGHNHWKEDDKPDENGKVWATCIGCGSRAP